ncbi:unnamed protein product [Hymenolepis diminuta]|uniref:Uncharacterized protein n=1 Tax=Hymenolepis diminuta TaxID=6216 RepID=A0A564Z367_HYMDI|nr:unnamed protein product [Hymenolepis diminuta]
MAFGVLLKLPGQLLSPSNESLWPNPASRAEILHSYKQNMQTFTILQNGKECAVSMDQVKSAYLDKLVTEKAISVFSPDPPVKETE